MVIRSIGYCCRFIFSLKKDAERIVIIFLIIIAIVSGLIKGLVAALRGYLVADLNI